MDFQNSKPPIYESIRLTDLTKKWINLAKIKLKDYVELTDKFKKELKTYTVALTKEKNFEFNKESIYHILDTHFQISK